MENFKSETAQRLGSIESQPTDMSGRITALEKRHQRNIRNAGPKTRAGFWRQKYRELPNDEKIRILYREIQNLAEHMKVPLAKN